TLKTDGVRPGDAVALMTAPHANDTTLAPSKWKRCLRKAKARIFIQVVPLCVNCRVFESEVDSTESLVEGPPGHAPCVQPNIACRAGAWSTTFLDGLRRNFGEIFEPITISLKRSSRSSE